MISSENENKSKHFRNHVGDVLKELLVVCKCFEELPVKAKAFNPYQLLQDAVNAGYHPVAVLETLKAMVVNWADVKDPWPWFHSICNTRSQNFYAKENEWKADDYKETIADLAKLDLFRVIGLYRSGWDC